MWELVFRVQLGFAEHEDRLKPQTGGERIVASVPQAEQPQEECKSTHPLAGLKRVQGAFACLSIYCAVRT